MAWKLMTKRATTTPALEVHIVSLGPFLPQTRNSMKF